MTPVGSVIVSSTTASTNSSTGALVVKGGLGVAGNINTAGNLNVSGSSVIDGSLKLSSMTSGSVLFAGTGGTVTQDNSSLYWDGANKRLGIGSNSPAQTLSVSGTSYFSGNVGIGTTNPAASFEISGTIKINGGSPGAGKVLVSDANGLASWQTTTPLGGASYDSGWFNIACDKTYQLNLGFTGFPKQLNAYYKLSNGQIIPWGVNHYGDAYQMNGAVLDYDATGKIYVRTSTPNGSYICGLFHVGYTRNRLDNGFDDLFNQNTGVQFRVIASDGAGGSQWSTASGSISYSEGNVGIGTASPTAKLDVAGEIKFGNTSSTCNAVMEGQQRYNSTSKRMEFCNGTGWFMLTSIRRTVCSYANDNHIQSNGVNVYSWLAGDCDNGVPTTGCVGQISKAVACGSDEDWAALGPNEVANGATAGANGGMRWFIPSACNGVYIRAIYDCAN